MTTGPKDFAERAASAFNRRDLEAMLALVSEAVLMPSADQSKG